MGLLYDIFSWEARRRRTLQRRERAHDDLLRLNLKFFGYELARQLAAALPMRHALAPQRVGLESKASTQADLESDWLAYWAAELKIPVVFHRKLWELAYVLQALHQYDLIRAGARGLGFGCGVEPIASYLASRGVDVTVTDLPAQERRALGWQDSGQHSGTLEQCFHAHLVSREAFDAHVELQSVDMNAIPDRLRGYDFNWSICALEHLGSIDNGLRFLESCLDTLRPGGVAVHTTEFNFMNDAETIDDWLTVLFQKRHFELLRGRLEAKGHVVAPLNFDVGSKPLDKFIDLPPFAHHWNPYTQSIWGQDTNHLKIAIYGFACTCFGLIIRKAGAAA